MYKSTLSSVRALPLIPTLSAIAGLFLVAYIGLLAVVMTYGVIEMQSAQAVRDTRAAVGTLETKYLAEITTINNLNPETLGYVKPAAVAYAVGSVSASFALRTP